MKVCVYGGGSFGSAVSILLNSKNIDTTMYIRNKERIEEIRLSGKNEKYLKNVYIPETIKLSSCEREAVEGKDLIVLAVPSQELRNALNSIKGYVNKDTYFVNLAKGIELDTHYTMSEVFKSTGIGGKYAVLSGPSHAEEVSVGLPTTVVVSSENTEYAEYIQDIFTSPSFRVYVNDDLLGVELAGALKNVIALGTGICDGRGYGDNTKAALITRGIHEISKLGVKLGAKRITFSGLAGIGDLVVTCTSKHSRNMTCGYLIGKGFSVKEAIEKVGMVVEGIKTTHSAYMLAKREKIDMPILNVMYKVIYENHDIDSMVSDLMGRPLKHETEVYEG